MVTIDEAEAMLDEVAQALPDEIFERLNGGIILRPEEKLSPHATSNNLYILGEYCSSKMLGRYILIYYGSFARIHGRLSPDDFREQLKKTLYHELTHHLESLAGEKDLEIKDAEKLREFLTEHGS